MIRNSLMALMLFCITAPLHAEFYDTMQIEDLYRRERAGIGLYESGDFGDAFNLLSKTACAGLKRSQYILSFMFLKGEGTMKSTLIGLAWLGVAIESGEEEWITLYDSLYEKVSEEHLPIIDAKVQEYIGMYGSDTQGISCAKAQRAGSRRVEIRCVKITGAYPDYDLEIAGEH